MLIMRNHASSSSENEEGALQHFLWCHEEEIRRAEEHETKLREHEQIDGTPIPPQFRELVVDPFDDSQDPSVHLQAFQMQMYISGRDDLLSCNLFLGTLTEVAMRWFSGLPPRSIGSFWLLESQFATNRAKCLEQYLARFSGATIQINDPIVKAFQKGLWVGFFSDSLTLSRPASMTEIQARAEKHMEAKEDKEVRLQREAHVEKYTPLKLTRAQILKEGLSPSPARHSTSHETTTRSIPRGMMRDDYLGHFVKRKESEKRTTGDETTIVNKIDQEAVSRVSRDPKAELPPSRNNNNNSWRGIHGRNVGHNLKEVLSIDVDHSRKTSQKARSVYHIYR
ncbi:hypothetical protein CR513_35806, partial [Mucuna pruriens]